ncbi:MAG TPA: HD domain-containing phosphohydrolase [Acidimicrobiia bacterium]|nr:HD domain-containing phosphohydrolase [Acidimicrobiia bacterium]
MARWHPRVLATASWLFPIAALTVGIYAASEAGGSAIYLLIAAAALVIGSMFGVATSNTGNRFTMGLAVAAAIPFVFSGLDMTEPAASIASYGTGLTLVWVLRHSRGEAHRELLPIMMRRFGGYLTYAVVYSSMRVGLFAELRGGWEDLFPFAVALAAWLTVEVAIRALVIVGPRELSRTYLARSLLQDLNVFMGLALTGALFGELFPFIQWWALAIALLPYSFAHSAFRRFQETKTTYRQTIRALARIPEVSGLGIDGHADRTTDTATSIAKEMGLGPAQVDDVEYAALMHDIGRVSLSEPQILKMGYTNDDLARWSAEIIAESPYLERVASQVRNQYESYRRPGEQDDPDISIISRVIKVAAAYDWKVHRSGMSPLSALEELHAGAAYEYDPEVVASLRRLLQGRGVLRPPARV